MEGLERDLINKWKEDVADWIRSPENGRGITDAEYNMLQPKLTRKYLVEGYSKGVWGNRKKAAEHRKEEDLHLKKLKNLRQSHLAKHKTQDSYDEIKRINDERKRDYGDGALPGKRWE